MNERYDNPIADTGDDEREQEAFDKVAIAFHEMVKSATDTRALETWASRTAVRRSLFDDMAIGRIRWPRSLGRPATPTLAEGFVVRSKFWVDIWHIDGNGSVIVDLEGWGPPVVVDLVDITSEPDHFSLRYMYGTGKQDDNRLEVSMANVPWSLPGRFRLPQRHYLSSNGFEFFSGGTLVSLPTIEVSDRPFFHV